MTLYELANSTNLQSNIEIKLFDQDGNEKETRFFNDQCDFDCYCNDVDEWEDFEVSFIYARKSADGTPWLVIEITE